MYKKLILTFTLAAGLSVLPNAFAAPSTKPGGPAPKPNTTNTIKHGEDSIDVLAVDITTAPEPKYRRPEPKPKPIKNHGLDSTIV